MSETRLNRIDIPIFVDDD